MIALLLNTHFIDQLVSGLLCKYLPCTYIERNITHTKRLGELASKRFGRYTLAIESLDVLMRN